MAIEVTFYNEYAPAKPENSRVIYKGEFEGKNFPEAFNSAERLALRWNSGETRENMIVHLITAQGRVRAIY
jgi:hypothetical protein